MKTKTRLFGMGSYSMGALTAFAVMASGCSMQHYFEGVTDNQLKQLSPPPGGNNPPPGTPGTPASQLFDTSSTGTQMVTVPAPVDLLWVIDNSGSMKDNQSKLALGIELFSQKYLVVDRDIRFATITTDAYCAGGVCTGANYTSADYARLLPGIADGVRPPINSGTRSGKPILTTVPDPGVTPANWISSIVSAFYLNAAPGITGNGSERGLQSIAKMLADNEQQANCQGINPATNCFFRKNTIRGIVIVSDEEDASMFPGSPARSTPRDAAAAAYNVAYGKNLIDNFFKNLDGVGADPNGNPHYFVGAIINQGNPSSCTEADCGQGQNYISYVNAVKADAKNSVGMASSVQDVDASNYNSLLDAVGATIQQSVTTITVLTGFTLQYPPIIGSVSASFVDMGSGAETPISSFNLIVNGTDLQLRLSQAQIPANSKLKVSYLHQ